MQRFGGEWGGDDFGGVGGGRFGGYSSDVTSAGFGGGENEGGGGGMFGGGGGGGGAAAAAFGSGPVDFYGGMGGGEGGGFFQDSRGGGFLNSQGVGGGGREFNHFHRGQTFLPLKISMIQREWFQNSHDNQVTILGMHLDRFRLVGQVRRREKTDQRLSFQLDDGSGLITCDWHFAAECNSEYSNAQLHRIQHTDSYVKAYGEINLLGKSEPHVRVLILRPIEDFGEVIFHEVDVAYHIIKIKQTRGELRSITSSTTTASDIQTGRGGCDIFPSGESGGMQRLSWGGGGGGGGNSFGQQGGGGGGGNSFGQQGGGRALLHPSQQQQQQHHSYMGGGGGGMGRMRMDGGGGAGGGGGGSDLMQKQSGGRGRDASNDRELKESVMSVLRRFEDKTIGISTSTIQSHLPREKTVKGTIGSRGGYVEGRE